MQDSSPSPSAAAVATTPPAKDAALEAHQRKIDGQLLQAIQSAQDDAAAASPGLSTVPLNDDGTVEISIRATVTDQLVQQVEATGAQVTYTSATLNTINARAPLDAIETIAKLPPVVFVVPKPQGTTRTEQSSPSTRASP